MTSARTRLVALRAPGSESFGVMSSAVELVADFAVQLLAVSVALQRGRLVDGPAAALLTAHEVLRLLRGGLRPAAGGLGVWRDRALHDSRRVVAGVRAPRDLVALLELGGQGDGLLDRCRPGGGPHDLAQRAASCPFSPP